MWLTSFFTVTTSAALESSQKSLFGCEYFCFMNFFAKEILKYAAVVTQQLVQWCQAAVTSSDSAKTRSWSPAAAVTRNDSSR